MSFVQHSGPERVRNPIWILFALRVRVSPAVPRPAAQDATRVLDAARFTDNIHEDR
jgi:hypothetical protein